MDRIKIERMLILNVLKLILDDNNCVLQYHDNYISCYNFLGREDLKFRNVEQCLVYWLDVIGEESFRILYGSDYLEFAEYIKDKLNFKLRH